MIHPGPLLPPQALAVIRFNCPHCGRHYELPEALYSRPEIQRITALACNATTIVNDLYSFTKELASDPDHLNLPTVVAANEGRGLKAAYLESVEIHNSVMASFEEEAAAL